MTTTQNNYKNQFLVAMPQMVDHFFADSLIYICEHSDEGSMGLIVNISTAYLMDDIFNQMNIECDCSKIKNSAILMGGPVQVERGFILHADDSEWETTRHINQQFSITTSRDILEATANGEGPKESLTILGYCAWASGQLDQEISRNDWLLTPADTDIIFRTPLKQQRFKAAESIGVDLNLFNLPAGHA